MKTIDRLDSRAGDSRPLPASGAPRAARHRLVMLVAAAVLGGFAVSSPANIVVRELPAPIVEVVPVSPGAGHHWLQGHWVWRGADWHWVKGHYVTEEVPAMPALREEVIVPAPSPAHVWVRGHWYWGDRAWLWAGGRWVPK
jgi:WXXGXW repeat (2 copies)